MRRASTFFATCLLGAGTFAAAAQTPASQAGKPVRLNTTAAPQLVDCAPVTQTPCMSAGVVPVDASGKPAPVQLPPPGELAKAFRLHDGDVEITPFYASAGLGPDAAQHDSVVLMLVDISGSMNEPAPGSASRFEAVKTAIGQFIGDMQEGSDRIAIVPFESHNVIATIRSAVYASTKAEAMQQLNALPAPGAKNNTALYQAVFSGVQSLQSETQDLKQRGGAGGVEYLPHLIVMTDGKNEVFPGDAPNLLNGDLGLQQAAAAVQASHQDVIGIGFGDRTAIDGNALQKLSTRFQYATDANQLLAALHIARTAVSHAIQLVWLLPVSHRAYLAGKDQNWTPELTLPSAPGQPLLGDPLRVVMPAIAAPLYARHANPQEMQALIAQQPPLGADWSLVVFHLLLFLVLALLLVALWYWVPRLVWGDAHQQPLPANNRRWASDKSGVTSASGVQIRSSNLPAGFEPAGAAGPLRRSAAQSTQVQPRSELSRTRLTFEDK